ncbi:clc channel [Dissophora ornata]|nr:clc channel [Dissophora ornata]
MVKEKLLSRRSAYYDDAKEALVKENNGIRIWYHNYTTIDWIHDFVKERVRLRHLRSQGGIRGMLKNRADSMKGWILVLLTGVITACLAAFIDVSSWWLGDLRMGYCTTSFWWSQYFCCWGSSSCKWPTEQIELCSFTCPDPCPEWVSWSKALSTDSLSAHVSNDTFDWIVYCCFGTLFAAVCVVMVTSDGTVSQQRSHGATKRRSAVNSSGISISTSRTSMESILYASQPKKIAYFGAGSGIPEVKTILGGFVIRGFLGFRTLMIKLIGLPLMVASGLNMGKQGPLVHIACCVANIVCRIFDKYNRNDGKRREILSAAAASGVAVAFGAPIGGVLFSLEEVSYYFPSKTMWRTYFCALTSAVVLKMINPYRVGKTVLFQVTYDRDWHLFESIPFIFISVLGGVYGAIFSQFHMSYSRFRSRTWIGRRPVLEVLIVTLITCAIQWLNPWTRVNLLQLLTNLYSECTPENNLNGMCATEIDQIYPIFLLLAQVFIMKVALNFITFGVKVPGGIFIPTMVAGAVFGRMVGLGVQWLIAKYPEHQVFQVCEGHSMDCVIPGLYAMIGAAACLSGVTRMTVSLVVIMFELTGAMTYSLPIMMAVMMGKFVGDAFSPDAFFNKLIDLNEHPYLDNKKDYNTFGTAADIADRYLETIDVNALNDVDSLRRKVEILAASGYSDGGLPIVDRGMLVGYIASNELGHALDLAEQKHPECICIFRNRATSNVPATEIMTSLRTTHLLRDPAHTMDFTPFTDQAPLAVSLFSSMDLVMELFIKLGIKYICVVKAGEHYGMIHKKRLLSFLKENDEKQKRNSRSRCF